MYSNLNIINKTIAVFLDLTKAFDTVNFSIVLGQNIFNLKWFKTYLVYRKQIVNINKTNGNEKEIKYGVPQGNVLNRILFILYKNEVCVIKIEVTYANDTCFLFSEKL